MHNRIYQIILVTVIAFASSSALAQYGPYWSRIHQVKPDPEGHGRLVTCGYFWSKSDGVFAASRKGVSPVEDKADDARLYYMEAGIVKPALAQPSLLHAEVTEIFMVNRDTGYASVERDVSDFTMPAGIMTVDGGRTWTLHTLGEAMGVMVNIKGEPRFISQTAIKTNFGWVRVRGAAVDRSFDGGLTWDSKEMELNPEMWPGDLCGVTYSSKFNTIVCVNSVEVGLPNGPFVSKDSAKTFEFIKDWGGMHRGLWTGGGDIRSGRLAMYAHADARYTSTGLFRSLDGGYSWKDVSGPGNYEETRISVIGCTGAQVIAFDTSGGIWYTETGGDGKMARDMPSHPTFENPGNVSASLCLDSTLIIPLLNDLCDDFRIDSIGLLVTDPAFDNSFYASGAIKLEHSQLPRTISTDERDSIHVLWDPKLFLDHDTTYTRKIFVRYYSGTDGKLHDTTINVVLTAKGTNPRIALDRDAIDFQATSTCFPKDTTVTITNTSCDTLTIDKLTGRGAFDMSGVATPLRLAPGEAVTLTIGFRPVSQGPQFGNVHIDATHQGIQRGFDIPLSGIGTPGDGLLELLSSNDVNLQDLSICATDDTVAIMRNTGCDTIIVRNVAITGSTDYTLISTVQNVVLAPDSSLTFRIAFAPRDKGTRTGLVTISWANERGANQKDITITLGANVIDGAKVLTSSIAHIDFGETSICEERDSVLRFTNHGCDTLTITGADVDQNFVIDGNFPITILPGQTIDLPITTVVDTAGKPRTLTGLLTVHSTANNVVAPVSLSRGLYYPTKLRLEAVDQTSGKDGDDVKFKIILDGDIPAGMTALHFNLSHNDDLLGFQSLVGQNLSVVITTGNEQQTQSFTLSPVRETGVIGELTFKVFLAIAEQTTFSFSNIRFDAANADGQPITVRPECIAVIADSGTRFDYVYTCGDIIIRDRLSGTRLIKRVTPNPASDEIRLELNVDDPAEIAVFNALGSEVKKGEGNRIDVSSLSSGIYYVCVRVSGSIETKRVIISR